MSDRSSFEYISNAIEIFYEEISKYSMDSNLLYIIGNKADKEIREVSKDEAEKLAKEKGLQYFEVSAKENTGIDDIFNRALESVC